MSPLEANSAASTSTLLPTPDAFPPARRAPPEAKQRKPRLLRNGVVVGKLRQASASAAAAAEQGRLHLAHTSTVAKLNSIELTSALTHHLIHLAIGVTTFPNSPPVVDLTSKWAEFRERGIYSRVCTPAQEVILASLIALGSRRSLHSSITGNNAAHGGKSGLGTRRETACRALADRAIRLAESSGVLHDTSDEAMEAMAVFRVTLFSVAPGHSFAGTLATAAHLQHRKQFQITHTSKTIDDLGLSILEQDGFTSLVHNLPFAISDRDLEKVYGWDPEAVGPALQRLSEGTCPDPTLQAPMRIVSVALLRGLGKLRSHDLPAAQSPKDALALFSKLWSMLDVYESIMLGFEHPLSPHRTIMPHLCAHPMIMEGLSMGQVEKFCAQYPGDPLAAQILLASRMRYLLWFKRFIGHMCDRQFSLGSDGPHMRALLLGVLEIYPRWAQLSFEAAGQDARESGPLSLVGLTLSDLRRLQENLHHCAAVFAHSGNQESRLEESFASLQLADEPILDPVNSDMSLAAKVMVDEALQAME